MFAYQKNYQPLAFILSLLFHSILIIGPIRLLPEKETLVKKHREIKIYPRQISKICEKKILTEFKSTVVPPPFIQAAINRYLLEDYSIVMKDRKISPESELKEVVVEKVVQKEQLEKFPPYMNYYNIIRERIKANAYKYYTCKKKGEVFLAFVVNRNGKVEDIFLNKKLPAPKELVEIAFRSVKEASPFPPFPSELKFPKLQFNISIYFKSN